MKRRLLALFAFLLLAYFVGKYSYNLLSLSKLNDVDREAAMDPFSSQSNQPNGSLQLSMESPADTLNAESFDPPKGLALSDELLVSFGSSQSYSRFLETARNAGLQLLGQNSKLLSVRIKVEDSENANRIRRLAGEEASIDYNFLVSIPSIPQPSPSGKASQPFENQALNWLGVPKDNQDWGNEITIALLDTGVSDHFLLNTENIESQTLIEDPSYSDSEYNGHGTAVASLLIGGDGLGISPSAKLVSIQVMDSEGIGNSFNLAEGIINAVDSGASVVSMSLGSYGYTRALQNAVDYALSNNVALVASAGNDGINAIPYPAHFEGVIGVTAIDSESQRAEFSNYSEFVDIAAPGVGVLAAWGDEQFISFSGTSAAAPYISGAIAATLSLNPGLSPPEAADIVLKYADDAGAPGLDIELGSGVLNMDRILHRDTQNIYDAAVGDFYLDYSKATETTIPLLITVQNRGTERLNSVFVSLAENNGIPQRVYLGSLVERETTAHTLYLDRNHIDPETGYSIQAETFISGREDDRKDNDTKSRSIQIPTLEP